MAVRSAAGALALGLIACDDTSPPPGWALGGPGAGASVGTASLAQPGTRARPEVQIAPDDLAGITRAWETMVAAMSKGDEEAVRAMSRGCTDGPDAFLDAFGVPTPPEAVRADPKKLARWPTRRGRITSFGADVAEVGLTLDRVDAKGAGGFVGPVRPSMPSVGFERDARGAWWVCSFVGGA